MENILGRVVYSKTGRDKGRMFIIVGVMGDRFVTLADRDLRKIEKPSSRISSMYSLLVSGQMKSLPSSIGRDARKPHIA